MLIIYRAKRAELTKGQDQLINLMAWFTNERANNESIPSESRASHKL
jgi:hypothetical protein